MKKIRFDYKEFVRVINLLKKTRLRYFIFGGYFMDAITGEETEHEDLDLIIHEQDKGKLINKLRKEGYKKKVIGRLFKFEREEKSQIYQIGVMILREYLNYYKIRGNRSEDIISKDAFNNKNYISLRDVTFSTMPFEWFSLYQKIDHFNSKKRIRHQKAMNIVTPFCKEIKILKTKPINRLKSDPKFKKLK